MTEPRRTPSGGEARPPGYPRLTPSVNEDTKPKAQRGRGREGREKENEDLRSRLKWDLRHDGNEARK